MKFTRIVSLTGVVVGIGWCVAGAGSAAVVLFALSSVVELLGAGLAGKQGNDTER